MLRHHDEEEKADSEGKQTAAPAVNGVAAAGEGRRQWTTGNRIEQVGHVIPTMGKWLWGRGGGDGAEDRIEHERGKDCVCNGKVQHERGKEYCTGGQAPWQAILADG